MPVREFVDSSGTEWRAWEVTPDAIFPPTRGEDYLADCYQSGWVVLETKTGERRLRLCPIPREWQRLPDEALEALLPQAEALPARTVSGRGRTADLPVVVHHQFQAFGNLAKKGIARRVAERIVDVLEAIEVDQEHGTAALSVGGVA